LIAELTASCFANAHSENQSNNLGHNVTLETSALNILFDKNDSLPLSYEVIKLKGHFNGKTDGQSIKIVVKNALSKTGTNITPHWNKTNNGEIFAVSKTDPVITPRLKRIDILKNQANVCYEGYLENLKIVSFTIRYTVKDQTVYITMEDVIEQNGYKLIEIQTSSLVSIYQTDGASWLAHGDGGDYYADLAAAKPCVLKDGWSKDFPYFPNFNYFPLVIMGNGKVNSSMEVQGYYAAMRMKGMLI
jgi:hypothetical protein